MKNLFALSLALLLPLFVAAGPVGSNTPTGRALGFLEAFQAGNAEIALSYYDLTGLEPEDVEMLEEKFVEMIEMLREEHGRMTKYVLESEEEDGEFVRMLYIATFENGETQEFSLVASEKKGKWSLDPLVVRSGDDVK